ISSRGRCEDTALLRVRPAHPRLGAQARVGVESDLAPRMERLIPDLQGPQSKRDGPPGERPGAGVHGRGPEVLVERGHDGPLFFGGDPRWEFVSHAWVLVSFRAGCCRVFAAVPARASSAACGVTGSAWAWSPPAR